MEKTNKKEIKLSSQMTTILTEIQKTVEGLQKQIQEQNEKLSHLVTGICLQEGVDFATQDLQFSEGFKTIVVLDKKVEEPVEVPNEEPTPRKKSKK